MFYKSVPFQKSLPNRLVTITLGSTPNLRPASQGYLIIPQSMDDIVIHPDHRDNPVYLDLGDMFKTDLVNIFIC